MVPNLPQGWILIKVATYDAVGVALARNNEKWVSWAFNVHDHSTVVFWGEYSCCEKEARRRFFERAISMFN